MENNAVAVNVAVVVKKSDYEEFIHQLDTILNDGDPLVRAMIVREHFQEELNYMNKTL